MPQRIFLGYSAPFLRCLTDYLLKETDSLADSLIIVPTSQSGRILRENLAAQAGALLAPTVSTPGAMLHLDDSSIAPRWLEKIAWIETFESIQPDDWENYTGLFPIPPKPGDLSPDWATSLASEMVSLRTILEESLHNLFSASKFLKDTPERDRWENLAQFESLMEKKLFSWGYKSRSSALRNDFKLPSAFKKIILAGITEMPSCLSQALTSFDGELTILIPAPESEKEHFSELGIPLPTWAERHLPETVTTAILADPTSQAQAALQAIASTGTTSPEIALGSADEDTGSALTHLLTHHGWPAFHPAARAPLPPLQRWLHAWKDWLTQPSCRNLAALLTFPESANLISHNRAEALFDLNKYRDQHPTTEPEDILQQLAKIENPSLKSLRDSIAALLSHRDAFLRSPFPKALRQHLDSIEINPETSATSLNAITDFLDAAAPLFSTLNRHHLFWLQILLSELPASPGHPPADRVIDIQGWLELLYEPGQHLIICGMNETFVPARPGGEPWLSENIRSALGIPSVSDRHARDSFLLHSMIRMRETHGSTHLFCGKNGQNNETFLPSRLLLQVPKHQLVATVNNLFREIEPPEANLIWTRDLIWQTPQLELPEKLGVTALSDYLACPFRFYLKHIVRASESDPDRREMNHREFGSVAHTVLENWGNDPDARSLTDPEKLSACFEAELHRCVRRQFGTHPPLAVRIQVQAIKQRLDWFAIKQAQNLSDGWEILHIERRISFKSNGFLVNGKIDRVDRHRDTGQLRVIDYKTGNVKNTETQHRQKIIASTKTPPHITDDSPARHFASDGKKAVEYLWKNLQLPLYALAESLESKGEVPIPCYIQLGTTEHDVKFSDWSSFSQTDLDAAKSCMDWVTSSISTKTFWPPAPRVKYDDYALLSQNAHLEQAFSAP